MSEVNVKAVCVEIADKLHDGFDYVPDAEQYGKREHWTSHEDVIKAGEEWKDDCDGFACSAMWLLDEKDIYATLIFCKVPRMGYHLVCGIPDEDYTWIIDNRDHRVRDWTEISYEWIHMLDQDGEWKTILNG